MIMVGISVLVLSVAASGQEISREQIKGLDEQVQEIKSDVLSIAAELNQLEEKLLYPSNTQVARNSRPCRRVGCSASMPVMSGPVSMISGYQ
jgi:hypothetical protein